MQAAIQNKRIKIVLDPFDPFQDFTGFRNAPIQKYPLRIWAEMHASEMSFNADFKKSTFHTHGPFVDWVFEFVLCPIGTKVNKNVGVWNQRVG